MLRALRLGPLELISNKAKTCNRKYAMSALINQSLVPVALRTSPHVWALGWLWSSDPGGEASFLLLFAARRPRHVWVLIWLWSSDPGGEASLSWLWSSDPGGEASLSWLWSSDPGGEASFLLHFAARRPRHVWVLGWLWSSDPGGEASFLLHFAARRPRHVWVLGWLWSNDPGGEVLFLLHFGPIRPRHILVLGWLWSRRFPTGRSTEPSAGHDVLVPGSSRTMVRESRREARDGCLTFVLA